MDQPKADLLQYLNRAVDAADVERVVGITGTQWPATRSSHVCEVRESTKEGGV